LVYIINLFIFASEFIQTAQLKGSDKPLKTVIMELKKEMSAQQSLDLITETIRNSRMNITRNSGKHFIVWGILLTVFSLTVYILWKTTGSSHWNLLWFAMPLAGYPICAFMNRKEKDRTPENFVSKMLRHTWTLFGIFSLSFAMVSIILGNTSTQLALIGMTPTIVLMFGLGESFSGILLKSRIITAGGWIIGIGGLIIYYLMDMAIEQMFIFTFAGIVLTITGIIAKHHN